MSMCLILGATILSSTTEIQLVLYSQCTVSAPKVYCEESTSCISVVEDKIITPIV